MKHPTELAEQHAFVQWLDLKKLKYFAVPNEVKFVSKIKSKIGRINFFKDRKKEGIKKGVPDLVVFLPNCILFVEMKRVKGSTTSDEQRQWVELINGYSYAKSAICNGADAAIQFTGKHLEESVYG